MKTMITAITCFVAFNAIGLQAFAGPEEHLSAQVCYRVQLKVGQQLPQSVPSEICLESLNINTATQAELESLDGIGPIKAQSIIDHRNKNGGFKSVDDLKQVDDIGNATLKNLRKNISITGPTTAVPPKANKMVKAIKPAKDIKAVGDEKAAASGKIAETKVTKEKSGK